MNSVPIYKTESQQLEVEYEVIPLTLYSSTDAEKSYIELSKEAIDRQIDVNQNKLEKINRQIDQFTNHSDKFDYAIAVASGILCGALDSFFVGELNFKEIKAEGHKSINKFIEKFAKLNGIEGINNEGRRLGNVIDNLEKKFGVPYDAWQNFSSTKLHHLEDFAHHPSPLGLAAAIIFTFFRFQFVVDKNGKWKFKILDTNWKDMKIWIPIIISGLLLWIINLVESKDVLECNEKVPKPIRKLVKILVSSPAIIQILYLTYKWFGHIISDLGGSKSSKNGGAGVPGLALSFLKELSSLPILKDTGLSKVVNDLYSKTKFDFRTEWAMFKAQSMPIVVNECIVRTLFTVRRLVTYYQTHNTLRGIDWYQVFPFANRTISRMMTIACGTFTAIDVADAAIRSAIKNGGNIYNPKLYADMVLRINFVGLGRLAIAIGTDISMGYMRSKKISDRITLMAEQIELINSRAFYSEAGMWIEAKNAIEAISKLEDSCRNAIVFIETSIKDMQKSIEIIDRISIKSIDDNNPELSNEINRLLKF